VSWAEAASTLAFARPVAYRRASNSFGRGLNGGFAYCK
jgi:hypothetical protein